MSGNSERAGIRSAPRAVIHKQILEAAEARSEASMAELAEDVNGVTVDIVERVLDEYGDPAEWTQDSDGGDESEPVMIEKRTSHEIGGELVDAGDGHQERDVVADPGELTEKQLDTLRAIHEDPQATQAELADRFDVTTATINARVNAIDGFEWSNRQKFVQRMFDNEEPENSPPDTNKSIEGLSERVDELTERIDALEQRLEEPEACTRLTDHPELLRKVLHACLESDLISDEEELDILEKLVGR